MFVSTIKIGARRISNLCFLRAVDVYMLILFITLKENDFTVNRSLIMLTLAFGINSLSSV